MEKRWTLSCTCLCNQSSWFTSSK